ncbi:hypothetical protein [Flavihumibacter petaseus]|uniref:Uncharacterized protein n=1 Tax=Flavihumibacter petaseus NBRC 106054 TaxID=1220578 RepID=A0A0E9N2V9_9BACT|nr:hypothetical protein [Flavihumibacter petaseus]GAO44164.1 hypothetical protein FPE01S_03_02020 [Flavihumibacter petaseus NBRC 106054]
MKFWTNEEKGDDRIIAFSEETLYRINPRPTEMEQVLADLRANKLPERNCSGVPVHYFKAVEMENGRDNFVVRYNADSYEHFRVKDAITRNEIYQYLQDNIKYLRLETEEYTKLQAGKKPLIATNKPNIRKWFGVFIISYEKI